MAAPSAARRWSLAVLCLLCWGLFSLVGLGSAAGADSETRARPDTVVQLPAGRAEVQRDKVLSAAARTAVNYVDAAAKAADEGESDQAGRLLAQARRLLDQVQAAIRERGAAAPITVVPVLARVHVAGGGEVSPELASRFQALEPDVLAGDQERVLAGLQAAGVGLTYEYVGMAVKPTSDGVEEAIADLKAGNGKAAADALHGVLRGLVSQRLTIGDEVAGGARNP